MESVKSNHIKKLQPSYDLDIDECKKDNGKCEHNCHNYEGGYWCSCKDGYKLKDDLHGCEGRVLTCITVIEDVSFQPGANVMFPN